MREEHICCALPHHAVCRTPIQRYAATHRAPDLHRRGKSTRRLQRVGCIAHAQPNHYEWR